MNRILVLYRSKYGYTKTYAQMIAEELGCDCREAAHLPKKLLKDYTLILYGGGLYASGINGFSAIRRHFKGLQGKRLIVWATGMCLGSDEDIQKIRERNLPGEWEERIPLFYLRGGFDYQKLSPLHRLMMDALRRSLLASAPGAKEARLLLDAYETPVYACSRQNIEPLLAYVRELLLDTGASQKNHL